ncbi:uncharacterized protein PV07_12414 [Cladophialophora immunda]|uniref:Uncharacterized protein n=1 Tax=Cladophialophora immunda TaxID=569365 RepID=A0A0D1Z4N0_9EURO|nr:uncharacterized protein PV07_12414 [Cladophialophora immunda]KIW22536.1 hypothetical protein PV07_12414 [Cladophialophora immunda]
MSSPNRSAGLPPDSHSSPPSRSEEEQRRHSFSQFLLPGDTGLSSGPSSTSSGPDLAAQTTESINGSDPASTSQDLNPSTTASPVEPPVGLRRVHATTDLTSLQNFPQITDSPDLVLDPANIPSEDGSLEHEHQTANQADNQHTRAPLFWTDEPGWSFASIRGVAANSTQGLPNSLPTQTSTRFTGTVLFWSHEPHRSFQNSPGLAVNSAPNLPNSIPPQTLPSPLLNHERPTSPATEHSHSSNTVLNHEHSTSPATERSHSSNTLPNHEHSTSPTTLLIRERSNSPATVHSDSSQTLLNHQHLDSPTTLLIRERSNSPATVHSDSSLTLLNYEQPDSPNTVLIHEHSNSPATDPLSNTPFIQESQTSANTLLIHGRSDSPATDPVSITPFNQEPPSSPDTLLIHERSDSPATEQLPFTLQHHGRIVNPLFPRPGQVTHTTQASQPSDINMTRLLYPGRRAFTTTPIPVDQDGARRSATDSQLLGVPRLRRVARSGSLRSLAMGQAEADEAEDMTAASAEAEEDGAPAQGQWQAPEDRWSSGEEDEEGEEGEEGEEDEEDEEEEGRVNLDEVDAPVAEQLRAGLAHLSEALVDIDVLDGDLPVGAARGNPVAVRARAGLLSAEGEILGAFGQLWRTLVEAREVAVDAEVGFRQLQGEVRRLTAEYLAAQIEVALLRERLQDEQ